MLNKQSILSLLSLLSLYLVGNFYESMTPGIKIPGISGNEFNLVIKANSRLEGIG